MELVMFLLPVCWFVYTVSGSSEHFKQLSDFRSHSCLFGSLFTHSDVSVFQCTAICTQHGPDCRGVSFNGATGQCHGCSARTFRNLHTDADSLIYKRVSACIDEHSPDDVNTIVALPMITNPLMCPTVILTVDNGYIGTWFTPRFCPVGTYAIGFKLREQAYQGLIADDTAINSVNLTCSVPDGSVHGANLQPNVGWWGDWTDYHYCSPGHVLKAYQIRVEYTHQTDKSGITDLQFKCGNFFTNGDMEILNINVENDWGIWGSWSETCGPGQGICGINVRVMVPLRMGDDTALNDVVAYCCY